jgi:hypothetical protein
MLKKFLAGLTAIALSLGMVALTAGPASAHQGSISASAVCNTQTGQYDVTYKLSWSSVPDGVHADLYTRTGTTSFEGGWSFGTWNDWTDRGDSTGASGFITWTESLPGTTNGNGPWVYAYTSWSNGYNGSTQHDTRIEGLDGDCGLPDDTSKKIEICHATASNSNPYTSPEVSVDSIITNDPNGHGTHVDDIIPPFDYIKQGVPGSYPGKNWDAYGQWLYEHNCSNDVIGTEPVITQAVCTAEGQVGDAKYVIPSILGVYYQTSSGMGGPWTTVGVGDHFAADGTSLWVRAVALDGYELAGNDHQYKWKLEFTDVDASTCVTPAAPTPTYQECTGPGSTSQAKYTIPSDSGIQYQRWDGTQWVDVDAGDVNVNSFPTTIQLQAIAQPGFTLVGSPTSWTFEFTSAGACLEDATPVEPTFEDAVCVPTGPGTTSGYYVINAADNVVYEVQINGGGWTVVDPATYGNQVNTSPGDFVEVRVTAAVGYTLVGNDLGPWSHTFANPGDCLDRAAAGDPVFVDEICTVDDIGIDDGYYTVIAGENVYYEVSFDSTDGIDGTWTLVDSLTYGDQIATSPGDHVWVRAIALAGYKLADGATELWDHTFAAAEECLDDTPVKPAIVVDQQCVVDESGQGSYTSGSIAPPTGTPHVTYYVGAVDGEFVDAVPLTMETPFAPGSYKVWALADEGYQLVGEDGYVVNDPSARVIQDGQLAYEIVTIHFAEACGDLIEHPVITPTVTFQQQACAAAGTYTLGVEEDDSFQGIIWTITPILPTTEGTHAAPTGAVHITATPADGFGFSGDVPLVDGIPTLTWDYVFELPDDCLPTLALTGGSIASGGLGLSALLVLGGMLIITARRRGTADMSA